MATKSYSKHKEYREYSSSGSGNTLPPYTDEQFDMIKSDLLPKGSKLDSLGRNGGTREYHYEYKEEKLPAGKYDRKDLHTVEEFTIPPKTVPKASESSSYYYEREERELPALSGGTRTYNYESSINSTPGGYSKTKPSKATQDLSQNVDELDTLLDDLQRDQERQLYKSGYTSDTAETSSFDYKRATPAKAPSSGYSTLKREERLESWGGAPPPPVTTRAELRQEMFREEKTESRVVPLPPAAPPAAVCSHCHSGTLSRSSTPMNKVTTTVKTYTYEVPAGVDPATLPLPPQPDGRAAYTTHQDLHSSSTSSLSPPAGCSHCSHCNSYSREYRTHLASDDRVDHTERMVYPSPANETKLLPPADPLNGHGPYGPSTYKYSETSYSSSQSRSPAPAPAPAPAPGLRASPSPFPRPVTPSAGNQQPPKKLDELMADFPEARFPTQPDGVQQRRKVEITHESSTQANNSTSSKPSPLVGSKNVAGPAVYYPPGHTPFEKKEGYEASAMQQGGGRHAAARGQYSYEAGARSSEKHSETKTAVPLCLPLCCAMPCVIM